MRLAGAVKVQLPLPSTTAVPNTVVPSLMVMVSPGDPVPANVGVLSPVLLSVLLPPVSGPAMMSGAVLYTPLTVATNKRVQSKDVTGAFKQTDVL